MKLSYNSKNSRFFLLYKGEAEMRAYLYINKRIDIDLQKEIFLFKDVYIITLKLREENANIEGDSIQIINIYNLSLFLVINNNSFNLSTLIIEL